MAAYVIVDVDIYDIEHFLEYQQAIRPLVEHAGGRYLARGGEFTVFEGDYQPNRLILIEFPSLEAIERFQHSDAYRALEDQRLACSSARIIGLKGL